MILIPARPPEIRRAERQNAAVGDALRALTGGCPVAGHELPERLTPPTDRPPGVDRFRVGWHLGITPEAAPAA